MDNNNILYVFTDGNCKNNGRKNAKAGYSVFICDDISSPFYKFNKSECLSQTIINTNNIAELTAFKNAFDIIINNKDTFIKNNKKEIIICSDSMYSINCIEIWTNKWIKNGWKSSTGGDVKNKELIQDILNLKNLIKKDTNIKISFKHVKAHLKEPIDKKTLEWFLWYGNNKVDTNINNLLL